MNRVEFLNRLGYLLQGIPENERNETLKYYNDYFDDAGVENEGKIILELGSPEKVAKEVREGLMEEGIPPFSNNRNTMPPPVVPNQTEPKRDKKTENMLLAVVIFLFAITFGGPIIGAVVGVIATIIGIAVGIGASAIGLFAGGIALIIAGGIKLFLVPVTGVFLIGAGFICIAFGILMFLLTVWIFGKAFPALIKWIIDGTRSLFSKRGGKFA